MRNLSRSEMKSIFGGFEDESNGSRCVVYCCDDGGNCGPGAPLEGITNCTSNEACQLIAVTEGAKCSSPYYVAALCKG